MGSPLGGIGGFVGLEPLADRGDSVLHPGAVRLSSGRAALARIVSVVEPTDVFVPTWMCPAVMTALDSLGVHIVRYPLGRDLLPVSLPSLGPGQLCLLLNPFGLGDRAVRRAASTLGAQLVVDCTQSVYQPPPAGSWGIASARKFFGVADGAFLWGPVPLAKPAARNARAHWDHLVARALGLPGALELFRESEAEVSADDLQPSALSDAVLDRLDHRRIRRRRRRNFEFLQSRLGDRNRLSVPDRLPPGVVPLFYPFLPKNEVPRESLHERRIWVTQLWPELDVDPQADDWARHLAQALLPLPVDQRYGVDEMRRVVAALDR